MTPDEVERRVKAWLTDGGDQKFRAAVQDAEKRGQAFVRNSQNVDWTWRADI